MKTAEITLTAVKESDRWFELANDLGFTMNQTYEIFEHGEYATLTIVVDENLNIIGGKIHRFKR